jgi:hypothetical protein
LNFFIRYPRWMTRKIKEGFFLKPENKIGLAFQGENVSKFCQGVNDFGEECVFKTQADLIQTLMETTKGSFAKSLGIDLCSFDSTEIFKWFLAAILYGARIPEEIAQRTFQVFARDGVICPKRILNTGWEGLVRLLDEGGYARYDFKTATKLLEMAGALENNYDGDLNRLHDLSRDRVDLEKRLQFLAKGIGQVTTNIFLREMRGIWEKANPIPADLCIEAARDLGLIS